MEFRGYDLEGISRLRGIAITEVVIGCLAVAGDCSKLFHAKSDGQIGGAVLSLAVAVFLLATGSFGLDVIKRSRAGESVPTHFRTLAILNIVLCALYTINLGMLIALSILSSMVFALISVEAIVLLAISAIINVVCIGLTFMGFKISHQNSGIIQSGGMKGKETGGGYAALPPPYTQCTEVGDSQVM